MIDLLCKVEESQCRTFGGVDLPFVLNTLDTLHFSSSVRLWETNMKGKEVTSLCSVPGTTSFPTGQIHRDIKKASE